MKITSKIKGFINHLFSQKLYCSKKQLHVFASLIIAKLNLQICILVAGTHFLKSKTNEKIVLATASTRVVNSKQKKVEISFEIFCR